MVDIISRMFAAVSNAARDERVRYHVTLGRMIDVLANANSDAPIKIVGDPADGPGRPHSYRGYYEDLAFSPGPPTTAGAFLKVCQGALGETFEGYKGGDFMMGSKTPLWFAGYGDCGKAIVGADWDGASLILTVKDLDHG